MKRQMRGNQQPPERPENPLARLGIKAAVTKKWEGKSAELKAEANAEAGEILLYGPIVDDFERELMDWWFGEGLCVSAKSFREKLAEIEGNVLVRINSPGGDVWECDGIMNAIIERRNAGDEINMIVDGLSASAASVIMVLGNHVKVGKLSSVMIHEISGLMYGNKRDFRDMADFLERFDKQAIDLYQKRMDEDEDATMKLLEAETWFDSDQVLENGLADEVVELDEDRMVENKGDDGLTDEEREAKAQREKDEQIFARRSQRMALLANAA